MTPEALLEQFDAMAEAPNGVQSLRELILQLAVRGKLVPQDPEDAPASVLLEQAAVERARLLQEGLLNRSKPLAPITEEVQPFDAPTGWVWARMGAIAAIAGGIQKTPHRIPISHHFPYLRVANVQRDGLDLREIERFELTDAELERWRLETGDLLIVEGNGSEDEIGRCARWNGEIPNCVHQNHLIRVRPFILETGSFLLRYLNSQDGMKEMKRLAVTTSGLFNLSVGKITSIVVPLPPLAEQRRVLAKVDELMAFCDQLEERQRRRVDLQARANRSALHYLAAASDNGKLAADWQPLREHFHLLYDAPERVIELRQGVLQLAARGKLIRFDPDAVTWPLEAVLAESSLNGLAAKPHDAPHGTPILRISAGTARRDAIVDELDHKYLDVIPEALDKFRLVPGDLLACRFNGNLHYVGRMSLYTGYAGLTHVYPDKLIRFRVAKDKADPAYVRYVFNAPVTRQEIESHCATTAGNLGISAGRLRSIKIPVPPLPTQHRIVAVLDELMALCDALETRLMHARRWSAHLASSVSHHFTAA